MQNQPWDNAKLAEWKKFWESPMGQEAIAKMNTIKGICLDNALQVAEADKVQFYVGRAAGVDLVLQDIQTGINEAERKAKEESAKKKK